MGLAAGIIEFFGGLMIAVGLFGSIVAFVACGEMAFAYFRAHAPRGFWPIMNRGELAVIYCFLFSVCGGAWFGTILAGCTEPGAMAGRTIFPTRDLLGLWRWHERERLQGSKALPQQSLAGPPNDDCRLT